MYSTSAEFKNIMAQPSRTLSARGLIIYPDTTQSNITAEQIVSIQISENAGDQLPLGSAAASTVTVQLDNREGEWDRGGSIRGNRKIDGAVIKLEIGAWDGGAWLWEKLGTYVLEDAVGQEQEPLITLRGMDYLGNKALRAYIDDLSYPMTLAAMADLACFQSGFARKAGAFTNSEVTIAERPEWPEDINCRDALGYIAEAAGGFARIDRNGQLEIASLSVAHGWMDDLRASSFAVDNNGDLVFSTLEGYDGPEFEIDGSDLTVDQDGIVRMVDGEIEIIALSDDESYYIAPSRYKHLTRQAEIFSLNAVIFEGREETETSPAIEPIRVALVPGDPDTALTTINVINPLLIPGKAAYTALKAGVTDLLGLSFIGASITWQGDPTITVGDCIKITDTAGQSQIVIVTSNALKFTPGFEMISGNKLKGDTKAGTGSSKPSIFTPDGKVNADAISGYIKRQQIGIAAIGEAHIEDLSVSYGKFKVAAIETLTAGAITAVRAHIQELIANEVVADELYAALADLIVANITTANIINANITWASIETLKVAIVDAVKARIEYLVVNDLITDELYVGIAEIAAAKIGTMDVDWAKIKDLVTGRQIFTEGVGNKLFIADLAVTEANVLSLTVGELVVRGQDGGFYSISVDEYGDIITTQKLIDGDDIEDDAIDGGIKIIEGSVTASRLNAEDIFANNALIQQLMAENIDVDILFAREGIIAKLRTDILDPINDAITISGFIRAGVLERKLDGTEIRGVAIGDDIKVDIDTEGNETIREEGTNFTVTPNRINARQGGEDVFTVEGGVTRAKELTSTKINIGTDWALVSGKPGEFGFIWQGGE